MKNLDKLSPIELQGETSELIDVLSGTKKFILIITHALVPQDLKNLTKLKNCSESSKKDV